MKEYDVTPCTTDLFEHGECCRWDDARGELSWVDVGTGRFFRAHADAEVIEIQRTYELPGEVTAWAPLRDRADGWIVALNESVLRLDESGSLALLVSPESHQASDVRMNDGSADPWGRFWIGSMAYEKTEGRGSLYRFDARTGLQTVLSNVTISNGLGWSLDRRTMYYVDSGPRILYAFDVDGAGDVSHQRVLLHFDGDDGTPDGLCIDGEGALWVAMWGGYEVRRYATSGELLARVRLPTAQPSCCTIGGANATTLYVTTAREDMGENVLAREPHAGRLFAVDVGVIGSPLFSYDDERLASE